MWKFLKEERKEGREGGKPDRQEKTRFSSPFHRQLNLKDTLIRFSLWNVLAKIILSLVMSEVWTLLLLEKEERICVVFVSHTLWESSDKLKTVLCKSPHLWHWLEPEIPCVKSYPFIWSCCSFVKRNFSYDGNHLYRFSHL